MPYLEYIPLLLLWTGWCTLHSLLIHPPVVRFIETSLEHSLLPVLPCLRGAYRLVYNCFSLVSLGLVVLVSHRLPVAADTASVFSWSGWGGTLLRLLLIACALLLFRGGARRYDMATFFGLRQLRSGSRSLLLGEGDFSASGVFAVTRHPWYLGSLLFVWTAKGSYSRAELCVVAVLSVYLGVGAWLEERKILAVYGDAYRAYQRQAPMLVPWRCVVDRNFSCFPSLFRKRDGG